MEQGTFLVKEMAPLFVESGVVFWMVFVSKSARWLVFTRFEDEGDFEELAHQISDDDKKGPGWMSVKLPGA